MAVGDGSRVTGLISKIFYVSRIRHVHRGYEHGGEQDHSDVDERRYEGHRFCRVRHAHCEEEHVGVPNKCYRGGRVAPV